MQFLNYLCNILQDFKWHGAFSGLSVLADLLVDTVPLFNANYLTVGSLLSATFSYKCDLRDLFATAELIHFLSHYFTDNKVAVTRALSCDIILVPEE